MRLRTIHVPAYELPHGLAEVRTDEGEIVEVEIGDRIERVENATSLDEIGAGDRITAEGRPGALAGRDVLFADQFTVGNVTASVTRRR